MLRNAIKAGLLAKAVSFARRPENQAKAKELIARARTRRTTATR